MVLQQSKHMLILVLFLQSGMMAVSQIVHVCCI